MDVARLEPATVERIATPERIEELEALLAEAHQHGLKVSIFGSRHSQGGQVVYDNALAIDMRNFDEVTDIDVESKTIRVQSGATWDDVQRAINPHGLAVKVMQSSNIFTVGGTLSANAHGRDLSKTAVVETVLAFRLLLADGQIVNVSRSENPELFGLVIGGYGLFGIILDVDLEVAPDEVYERTAAVMDYRDFPSYFQHEVRARPEAVLMLARPSIDPSPGQFLREMVVTTWSRTERTEQNLHELTEEKNVLRDRFFFSLSRKYDWAKALRWSLQVTVESDPGNTELITRNNSMRPSAAPLEFLDYHSTRDTDIVQEYFVPIRNFVPFMDAFRQILLDTEFNVISSPVRYVKANAESTLAYAPNEDAFAILHVSNVRLSEEGQRQAAEATRELVDVAARFDGSYYLTYQLYPTAEQLRRAYPGMVSR